MPIDKYFVVRHGRLSEALSGQKRAEPLNFDGDYVDAARTILATLSGKVTALPSGTVALTEQQVETFLDFDSEFLEVAKDMLRAFIEKTEGMSVRGGARGH